MARGWRARDRLARNVRSPVVSRRGAAAPPPSEAQRAAVLRSGAIAFSRRLEAFFTAGGWFDRAAIVRHSALCLAALLAYVWRFDLRVDGTVLWIIAAAAVLNFLSFLGSGWPRIGALSRVLSPALGVGGWAALLHLTGGVQSPFVAGFGLEILLAARTFGVRGAAWVASGAILALWLQQFPLDAQAQVSALVVHSVILFGIGAVAIDIFRFTAGDGPGHISGHTPVSIEPQNPPPSDRRYSAAAVCSVASA